VAIVTLLTDFGLSDAFTGIMKGVVLSRAPGAQLVDITHLVPPGQIVAGAFLLESAWRFFPTGSVHLAVVDPGVGSSRRRVALEAEGHYFVGPDNGLLSCALPEATRPQRRPDEAYRAQPLTLPPSVKGVAIEPTDREGLSATFEGRDVFAPAAGHLASGGRLSDLGSALDQVLALSLFRAPRSEDGVLRGIVLHIDSFGNAITDLAGIDLPRPCVVEVAGRRLELRRTYAESEGVCALVSSAGRVEVAMPNGNAARDLRLAPGTQVNVRPGDSQGQKPRFSTRGSAGPLQSGKAPEDGGAG
jgi:S-adenosyl-L-methionine hydrolase (adenosine-forming)